MNNQSIHIRPRGWFSRLIWPLVRWQLPDGQTIAMLITAPEGKRLAIESIWMEFSEGGGNPVSVIVEEKP